MLSTIRKHLFWKLEVQSFVRKSARVLAAGFPNQERTGCPDTSVLLRIAAGAMPLTEASPFMQHLVSCSACFCDFRKIKAGMRRRTILKLSYGVATVAIMFLLGAWWMKASFPSRPQTAVLDLRDLSPVRGIDADGGAARHLPELSRFNNEITVFLPIGAEGHYAIQFRALSGAATTSTEAESVIENSAVRVTFKLDLHALHPGRYELSLHSDSGQTSSYQVELK